METITIKKDILNLSKHTLLDLFKYLYVGKSFELLKVEYISTINNSNDIVYQFECDVRNSIYKNISTKVTKLGSHVCINVDEIDGYDYQAISIKFEDDITVFVSLW